MRFRIKLILNYKQTGRHFAVGKVLLFSCFFYLLLSFCISIMPQQFQLIACNIQWFFLPFFLLTPQKSLPEFCHRRRSTAAALTREICTKMKSFLILNFFAIFFFFFSLAIKMVVAEQKKVCIKN